jgi:translation initiation factor IF-3
VVLVAEKADPPVAKIIDFKKFKYQEDKKEQAGKKKAKQQEVKEFRFTPFIAPNDFEMRVNRARKFLEKGDKVKLTVKFIGRQITRKEFGEQLLNKATGLLSQVGAVESPAKWQGRLLTTTLRPTGK